MDIKPPKHLKPVTKKWWLNIAQNYELDSHHFKLLTLACEALERCQDAREGLKVHGTVYIDRFGCPHARPEVAIERDNRIAFARLIRELCLDADIPEDSRVPRLKS